MDKEALKQSLIQKCDFDLEYLNTLSDKELYNTAIYHFIYEIEIVRRNNDGVIDDKRQVDDEFLEDFLIKTFKYIDELKEFYVKLRSL